MDPGRAFEAGVDGWLRNVGHVRNRVRQRLVATQVSELASTLGGPLRVLDVGCGQGTQALALARVGHAVTGLDPSPELLERFAATVPAELRDHVSLVQGPGERAAELAPGPFDLVLCHGVLMYLSDPTPLLSAIDAVAAPGAGLALLVRNGLAPAMRPGSRGEWRAALDAFDDLSYVNGLGLPARMHTPDELDGLLAPRWRPHRWYGVRIFSDHGPDPDPADEDDLVAAETEAGRREPYRRVAALLHLQYRR